MNCLPKAMFPGQLLKRSISVAEIELSQINSLYLQNILIDDDDKGVLKILCVE